MKKLTLLFLISFGIGCVPQPDFKKDGGLRLVMQIDDKEMAPQQLKEVREKTIVVLRNRLDYFGISNPGVEAGETPGQIVLELPGKLDQERINGLLQMSSNLAFCETYDNAEIYPNLDKLNTLLAGETGGQKDTVIEEVKPGGNSLKEQLAAQDPKPQKNVEQLRKENPLFAVLSPAIGRNEKGEAYLGEGPVIGYADIADTAKVNKYLSSDAARMTFGPYTRFKWCFKPLNKSTAFTLLAIRVRRGEEAALSGDIIKGAKLYYDSPGSDLPKISITMTPGAAIAWKRITASNIGRSIAITLNDQVYSYPTVTGEISGGVSVITGSFTREEAKDLVNIFQSGYLPASLKIISEEEVKPLNN